MTVENCGRTVTIPKLPERVVAVSDDTIDLLETIGAVDKIVGTGGLSLEPVLSSATLAHVRTVRNLGQSDDLTTESILEVKADLVLEAQEGGAGPSYDDLKSVGIPYLTGSCAGGKTPLGFDKIEDDVLLYGRLFGREQRAEREVAAMRSRVDAIQKRSADIGRGRTAAALYVAGDTVNAYGRPSVAQKQFDALGLQNVFADTDQRFFEPGVEELIKRDPDVIEVVTYPLPDVRTPTIDDLRKIPGLSRVTAIRNGDVLFQPYAYSSQGPAAIEGLERMAQFFGG